MAQRRQRTGATRQTITARDLHWGNAPLLHGSDEKRRSWQISDELINFIDASVTSASRTLETGAGVSTVLFALKGSAHTCIVPFAHEVDRIKEFCSANAIDDNSITYVVDRSERALPQLADDPLDLVLIDGNHGFPSPMIDCYLTADRIRVGGLLILDDTQLWSVNIVKQFLMREPEWAIDQDMWPRSAIFRRTAKGSIVKNAFSQPYVVERTVEMLFPEHIEMIRQFLSEQTLESLRTRSTSGESYTPIQIGGPAHHSQYGQDALIGDVLFRGRSGVFVDVGARDGRVISNTLYLEQALGWTGIAVEPHPDLFEKLRQTRSCRCVNVAAGREPATLQFVKLLEEPVGNSGLLVTFRDSDRLQRMKHEIVNVKVEPLSAIVDVGVIHYLDVDVEGHELAVLQGIDFDRVEIRVIGVETGANRQAIDAFLASKGFRPFVQLHSDRFYAHGNDTLSTRRLADLP